jgi:hypothetical protein
VPFTLRLNNEKGARVRQSARAIANLLQIDAEKLPWFVCVTPHDFDGTELKSASPPLDIVCEWNFENFKSKNFNKGKLRNSVLAPMSHYSRGLKNPD